MVVGGGDDATAAAVHATSPSSPSFCITVYVYLVAALISLAPKATCTFRSHPRKGPCQCAPTTTSRLAECHSHRDGSFIPRVNLVRVHVEFYRRRLVAALLGLHFAEHQASETEAHSSPLVLPSFPIRRAGHHRGAYECQAREYTQRSRSRHLCLIPGVRTQIPGSFLGRRLHTLGIQRPQRHVEHVFHVVALCPDQPGQQGREAKGR